MSAASSNSPLGAITSLHEELQVLRRHLHAHPELAYKEHATSELVARMLQDHGYVVTRNIGGTGVVASMTVGEGKRSIGIRADMDALPIHEATELPYASVNNGVMHACGHDGHTTMLLGAAKYLAGTRNFSGTVHLIFQPAEEIGSNSGAASMIADGLFERFPCDAVFGLHNHPGVEEGKFLFRSGPFMAAGDKALITIRGVGGHAARPHLTVDPVVVSSSIVMALQTIVSRNIDPTQAAVVTVGVLRAGSANNVIPDTATLELSIRSFNEAVRKDLRKRIEILVTSQAASYGASADIEYIDGYPVVVNTPAETAFAIEVAKELAGSANVVETFDLVPASEDFAFMLQERPGCFFRLGNGVGADRYMVHHPKYDFNDSVLPIGAAFWALLVERFLS
jgi:hippurate hydrolase